MQEISSLMNNTFFVYVKENLLTMHYLYKARKDYYGTHKIWWGTSENYQLLKKEYFKQITGQILSLRKSYDDI